MSTDVDFSQSRLPLCACERVHINWQVKVQA
jgi:hypothetical protein